MLLDRGSKAAQVSQMVGYSEKSDIKFKRLNSPSHQKPL
jgi:hypothetical protein